MHLPALRHVVTALLAIAASLTCQLAWRPTCRASELLPLPPVECEVVAVSFDDLSHGDLDAEVTLVASQLGRSRNSHISVGRDRMNDFNPAGLTNSTSTRQANDFTSDPEFLGGAVLRSGDFAAKVGGYVKADLIQDLDPIDATDAFDTTSIPTDAFERQNTRFHARQTRLSVDSRWRVDGRVARAFIEADFFGVGANGSDAVRLRHAYGQIGRFTAGQTWTTFTDPSAVPQTIDFEGGVSNVNRRQALVRWTEPIITEGFSLAIALEDPSIIVDNLPGIDGEGRTESPDLVIRPRYEFDWGEFQVGFLARRIGYQPPGQPVIDGSAWGVNFAGSFMLTESVKLYHQITFGDGIGSYRGSPDVVATGPTTATIQSSFGWMIGAKHEWSEILTSNFTFSDLSLDDVAGQPGDNLRRTQYFAANVVLNPYERLFCGIEYLYGLRQDVDRDRGEAHRLQVAFGFFLP